MQFRVLVVLLLSSARVFADDAALEARLRGATLELTEKKQIIQRLTITHRALDEVTLKLALNDRSPDGLEQKLGEIEPKGARLLRDRDRRARSTAGKGRGRAAHARRQ